MALLARTAGIRVVGKEVQHLDTIRAATYIGLGKVEALARLREVLGFELVIFDDELRPAQLRNLEDQLNVRVLDRTALILDIFAQHAHTKEGALQVELAQYVYRLPRLTRMWTHLSRQGVGGVGLRGPGETQLEIDRREIAKRIRTLRRELEQVRQQRRLQRQRRRRQGLPVISIVGYTNAGKSTLLNRLSNANVLVQDQLFATLDPTTRRVTLPSGKEALFSDTVGFIQKLPTELIAAFRATLEQVREADILIHVADVADEQVLTKVRTVERVLEEIGAGDKPTIVALNKVDLIDPEMVEQTQHNRFSPTQTPLEQLRRDYERVVLISAEQGVGIEELLATVERVLAQEMVYHEAVMPYSAGELVNLWHTQGIVEKEEYLEEGIRIGGRLPRWLLPLTSGEPEQEYHKPDESEGSA